MERRRTCEAVKWTNSKTYNGKDRQTEKEKGLEMSLIKRKKQYTEKDFIKPKEMGEITGYHPQTFTDAKLRAEFRFDFTIIRLKPNSKRILFLRKEFNDFLHRQVDAAMEKD